LWFNSFPATVFMGDTGSLALGGGIAGLAIMTGTELLLIVIGGIFVIATLTVIIQVCQGQSEFALSSQRPCVRSPRDR
jgi:phospho-N-acetylmuramoyl-pentapeptide-transferase